MNQTMQSYLQRSGRALLLGLTLLVGMAGFTSEAEAQGCAGRNTEVQLSLINEIGRSGASSCTAAEVAGLTASLTVDGSSGITNADLAGLTNLRSLTITGLNQTAFTNEFADLFELTSLNLGSGSINLNAEISLVPDDVTTGGVTEKGIRVVVSNGMPGLNALKDFAVVAQGGSGDGGFEFVDKAGVTHTVNRVIPKFTVASRDTSGASTIYRSERIVIVEPTNTDREAFVIGLNPPTYPNTVRNVNVYVPRMLTNAVYTGGKYIIPDVGMTYTTAGTYSSGATYAIGEVEDAEFTGGRFVNSILTVSAGGVRSFSGGQYQPFPSDANKELIADEDSAFFVTGAGTYSDGTAYAAGVYSTTFRRDPDTNVRYNHPDIAYDANGRFIPHPGCSGFTCTSTRGNPQTQTFDPVRDLGYQIISTEKAPRDASPIFLSGGSLINGTYTKTSDAVNNTYRGGSYRDDNIFGGMRTVTEAVYVGGTESGNTVTGGKLISGKLSTSIDNGNSKAFYLGGTSTGGTSTGGRFTKTRVTPYNGFSSGDPRLTTANSNNAIEMEITAATTPLVFDYTFGAAGFGDSTGGELSLFLPVDNAVNVELIRDVTNTGGNPITFPYTTSTGMPATATFNPATVTIEGGIHESYIDFINQYTLTFPTVTRGATGETVPADMISYHLVPAASNTENGLGLAGTTLSCVVNPDVDCSGTQSSGASIIGSSNNAIIFNNGTFTNSPKTDSRINKNPTPGVYKFRYLAVAPNTYATVDPTAMYLSGGTTYTPSPVVIAEMDVNITICADGARVKDINTATLPALITTPAADLAKACLSSPNDVTIAAPATLTLEVGETPAYSLPAASGGDSTAPIYAYSLDSTAPIYPNGIKGKERFVGLRLSPLAGASGATSLSGIPSGTFYGPHALTYRVTELRSGRSATSDLSVTVLQPPLTFATDLTELTFQAGSGVLFQLPLASRTSSSTEIALDAMGYVYTAPTGLPAGVSYVGGAIVGTPTATTGESSVVFQVTEPMDMSKGLSARTASLTLTIKAEDSAFDIGNAQRSSLDSVQNLKVGMSIGVLLPKLKTSTLGSSNQSDVTYELSYLPPGMLFDGSGVGPSLGDPPTQIVPERLVTYTASVAGETYSITFRLQVSQPGTAVLAFIDGPTRTLPDELVIAQGMNGTYKIDVSGVTDANLSYQLSTVAGYDACGTGASATCTGFVSPNSATPVDVQFIPGMKLHVKSGELRDAPTSEMFGTFVYSAYGRLNNATIRTSLTFTLRVVAPYLPTIPDVDVRYADSVFIDLPKLTGGIGAISYTATGLPSQLTFSNVGESTFTGFSGTDSSGMSFTNKYFNKDLTRTPNPGTNYDPLADPFPDAYVIFGTPTTEGSSTITLTATDSASSANVATATFMINVYKTTEMVGGLTYSRYRFAGLEPTLNLNTGEPFTTFLPQAPSTPPGSRYHFVNAAYEVIGTLPSGLAFDPTTRMLSGTPTTALSGAMPFSYRATGGVRSAGIPTAASLRERSAPIANGQFAIMVSGPVFAPTTIADVAINRGLNSSTLSTITLPTATSAAGGISYALSGVADIDNFLGGLSYYDATAKTISGTVTQTGRATLNFTATDMNGASATLTFNIDFNGPTISGTVPATYRFNRNNTSIPLTFPGATATSGGVSVALVSEALVDTTLPNGIAFDSGTRTLSSNYPPERGTFMLTYRATDANNAYDQRVVEVNITGPEFDAPVVNRIFLLNALVDVGSAAMPTAKSNSPATSNLTYSVGSGLPAGLAFSPIGLTFSGTPSVAGTTTFTYQAGDGNDAYARETFTITITDLGFDDMNGDLESAKHIYSVSDGALSAITLPAGIGSGVLSYQFTPTSQNGLAYDTNSKALTITPSALGLGLTTFTYTLSAGANNVVKEVTITVRAVLAFASTPTDIREVIGASINTTFPEVTAPAGVSYSVTGLGGTLAFDPATRVLSGTSATNTTFTLAYTATNDITDTANANRSVTQSVTVEFYTPTELPTISGGGQTRNATVLPNASTPIDLTGFFSALPGRTLTYYAILSSGTNESEYSNHFSSPALSSVTTFTVSNGMLSLTATALEHTGGDRTDIQVQASDQFGNKSFYVLFLSVAVSSPPALNSAISDVTLSSTTSTSTTIDLRTHFGAANESLQFTTTTSAAAGKFMLALSDAALTTGPVSLTVTGCDVITATDVTVTATNAYGVSIDDTFQVAVSDLIGCGSPPSGPPTRTTAAAPGLSTVAPNGTLTYDLTTFFAGQGTNSVVYEATGDASYTSFFNDPVVNNTELVLAAKGTAQTGQPAGKVTVTAKHTRGNLNPSPSVVFQVAVAEAPSNPRVLPDVTLSAAASAMTFDLTTHFGVANESLAFTAVSTDVAVLQTTLSASTLVVSGCSAGTADVTVTATNNYRLSSMNMFTVTVEKPDTVPSACQTTAVVIERVQEAVTPVVAQVVVSQALAAVTQRISSINVPTPVIPSVPSVPAPTPSVPSSATGVQQNLSASLGGYTSVDMFIASNLEGMANGAIVAKDFINGSKFNLPLKMNVADGDDSGLTNLAMWGSADYRRLSGDVLSALGGALNWGGNLLSLNLGVDTRLDSTSLNENLNAKLDDWGEDHAWLSEIDLDISNLLVGASVSWSDAEFDYVDTSAAGVTKGKYTLDLTTISPYAGWRLNGLDLLGGAITALDMWATAGYGQGDLSIKSDAAGRGASSDIASYNLALGANGQVWQGNLWSGEDFEDDAVTTVVGKSEVAWSKMRVQKSPAGIDTLAINSGRIKLAAEGSQHYVLDSGAAVKPAIEVGIRRDVGDGTTGGGMEFGASVHYQHPSNGISAQGNARSLLSHEYDEWGVNGLIRIAGNSGTGLELSLSPSYGDTGSDIENMWDNGAPTATINAGDYVPRVDARLGYGWRAPVGKGIITPYTEMNLNDGIKTYRAGTTWKLNQVFDLDLQTERQYPTASKILLKGEVKF